MQIFFHSDHRNLTVQLKGEIDHHSVKGMMSVLSQRFEAELPRSVILDFSGVSFTDSSGIALLLRSARQVSELGGTLRISGVPPQAERVFRTAGLYQILTFF